MEKLLVSRCLLGHKVRYDGGAHGPLALLLQWQAEGRVVALCPEVAGGLPTPRPPAEIPGGQGGAVLDGRLPVLTDGGADVTAAFVAGAEIALYGPGSPLEVLNVERLVHSQQLSRSLSVLRSSPLPNQCSRRISRGKQEAETHQRNEEDQQNARENAPQCEPQHRGLLPAR